MKSLVRLPVALLTVCLLTSVSFAEEEDLSAIRLGLKLTQKGAANYPNNRKCFSCHHQTLPMLVMAEARDLGIEIDEKIFTDQAKHTHRFFRSRLDKLLAGKGIGGSAMTVSYGLWTYDIAKRKPSKTTAAMVTFLLKTQKEDGHWKVPSFRPPLEESDISVTVLSAYGMDKYATDSQREEVDQAIQRATRWLDSAPKESHEDFVFRLWGLHLLGGDEKDLLAAREAVFQRQRDDGGWAQLSDMQSDAYATGQTLYVLKQTGLSDSSPEIGRGEKFLRSTQKEDGSWFVQTRAKPVQVFFDNGDPHGKSQFISITATSWAVVGLADEKGAE